MASIKAMLLSWCFCQCLYFLHISVPKERMVSRGPKVGFEKEGLNEQRNKILLKTCAYQNIFLLQYFIFYTVTESILFVMHEF